MNKAAVLAFLGGGESASFVAGSTAVASAGSITFSFSGMAAGNLAVIYLQNSVTTPGALAGWTAITLADWTVGYHQRFYKKLLDAADIIAGSVVVANADNHGEIVAYSGASDVVARSFDQSATGASTLVLSGFTLAANTAGVVIFVDDSSTGLTAGYAPPAAGGLANRLGPVVRFIFAISAWDFLVPGDYPEQPLTFTGFDTTAEQVGHVLELLK